jgi:hypothetical protein
MTLRNLVAIPECLLRKRSVTTRKLKLSLNRDASIPITKRFFSGNLLPLATDSSMEVHRFLFGSPFRLSPSPDVIVYVDILFAMVTVPAPQI